MGPFNAFLVIVCVMLQYGLEYSGAEEGSVSPSPSVAMNVVPPMALPVPEKVSADEIKKIRIQMKALFKDEARAFDHQERSAMKELVASQATKIKQWREREKKARHDYFDAHPTGPEQRHYVLEFVKRKKGFDQSVLDETQVTKRSWREKRSSFQAAQREREAKFEAFLKQGQRPDAALWKTP